MTNNDGKRNIYPESYTQIETTKRIVCSFNNLLEAEKRCLRKVNYKNSVSRFDLNLLTRIYELREELINGTYKTQLGQTFEIFEPKYRKVTTTKFKDRIPQASFVINYMYPKIIATHTRQNCACTKNKGLEYARELLKEAMRSSNKNEYFLKADFKDYFGSINHNILFNELKHYMPERWVQDYFKDVINCNQQVVGIGLGSEINQLSAVSFIHKLDYKFINAKYIRYMDDIIFIGSKEECIKALRIIEAETKRLHINLSKKKTYIQSVRCPIKFLGFSFQLHDSGKITLKRLKNKLNNEKRKLRKLFYKGIPDARVKEHYQSVRSCMNKGARSGVVKLDRYFNNIYRRNKYYAN